MLKRLSLFVALLTATAFSLSACGGDEPADHIIVENNDEDPENNQDPNNQDPNNTEPNNQTPNNQSPGEDSPDGGACDVDADCMSGTCLDDNFWQDGHCTTVGCSSFEDCSGEGAACLDNPEGPNLCVQTCSSQGECRDGYGCVDAGGGTGICFPSHGGGGGGGGGGAGGSVSAGSLNVDFDCVTPSGQIGELHFEIDSGTDQYMIVPFTGGADLFPLEITGPGDTVDFQGSNNFQATGSQLFGMVNPIVVPAAPQFSDQLAAGPHTLSVSTDASDLCYYKFQSSGTATTIDLNIYPVGISGITAQNAESNPNMSDVMNNVESLLAQANIDLGEVRYIDLPDSVINQYSVIQGEGDISALAAESVVPGDSEDDVLSANIFITQSFSMGGALGLSLGIPGAAGWHESGLSGVALTGEHIGTSNGNSFTANILAHELGHFLGLFHTTEMSGNTSSPLTDTGQCTNFQNPTNCSDWGNLMFPSADPNNTEVTDQQSFVIGVNPLTK